MAVRKSSQSVFVLSWPWLAAAAVALLLSAVLWRSGTAPEAPIREVKQDRATLVEMVEDRNEGEAWQAITDLGKTRDLANRAVFEKALEDERPAVRAAAAKALGRLENWETIPVLLDVMEHDEDADVRRAAQSALHRTMALEFEFDPGAGPTERALAVAHIRKVYPDQKPLYDAYMERKRNPEPLPEIDP